MARIFKNWLRAYLDYTIDSESPERVHFWVGVSVIAGALRRRVWIEQPNFDWTPNFYIILVGPPGVVTKTTSMNMGMGLLEQIKDIRFGPDSLTWQALGVDIQAAADSMMLGEERIEMSCLTIAAGELGTMLKLEDNGLETLLIAMWDGQRSLRPFRHLTISSSQMQIQNPCLNIIGCTTPAWMKQNFPEYIIGGGLTSRILFVFADKKRRLIAYPSRMWGDTKDKQDLRTGLIEDLKEISELKGRFKLTPEAMDWGEAWYERNWTIRPAHLASERFSSYIARKQTSMHKIAMILAAAQSNDLVITKEILSEADAILTSNETDMLEAFKSIGVVDEARHVQEIAQLLRINGPLPTSMLFKQCQTMMDHKTFEQAVLAGIAAGTLEKERLPAGMESKYRIKLKGETDAKHPDEQ